MKISQQPTNHILVKATCQSEWDNCDFAIITCDEGWVDRMEKRICSTALHSKEEDFQSLKYYDISADFYVLNDSEEDLLSIMGNENKWIFVDLEQDEEDNFDTPENCLDRWTQVLFNDGTARHLAYDKHTGEEFRTEDLPLKEIVAQIRKNKTSINPREANNNPQ